MTTLATARSEILERLNGSYAGKECAWERFYQPKFERANFATRYHLVYPALAYFVLLKREPERADVIRPLLDTMYRGLLHSRTWNYWHAELGEIEVRDAIAQAGVDHRTRRVGERPCAVEHRPHVREAAID